MGQSYTYQPAQTLPTLLQAAQTPGIVPLPNTLHPEVHHTQRAQGKPCVLLINPPTEAHHAHPPVAQMRESLIRGLELRQWEVQPSASSEAPQEHTWELAWEHDPDCAAEGYRISTTDTRITISAATASGAFYAGITLGYLATMPLPRNTTVVQDAPRFAYRGMLIDLARSYHSSETLRDLIDACALLKLNTLHLHLVDDQGWRIEITNEGKDADDPADYTQLHLLSGATAVNAGDNPGFDTTPDTTAANPVHGDPNKGFEHITAGTPGWYSQNELRELVAYAAQRHIRIIPELEFPGHNHSVLYALPHLATPGSSVQAAQGAVEPWTRWQVGYSYLDFDNPYTWAFAAHVMRQCGQIFGFDTIHLGADECYKLVERVGEERYDQITAGIVELAHEVGFQHVHLWQEGVRALGQAHPEDAMQLWNYVDEGEVERLLAAADAKGVGIINSDARHIYLDQKIQVEDQLGLTWAVADGLTTPQAYEWDPAAPIASAQRHRLRGIEACLWSESVRSEADIAYLTFPRLHAAAEVAWTQQEARDGGEFLRRIGAER